MIKSITRCIKEVPSIVVEIRTFIEFWNVTCFYEKIVRADYPIG